METEKISKPKTRVSVSIDPDELAEIRKDAKKNKRSLSSEIMFFYEKGKDADRAGQLDYPSI